jgi:hypothetical protein
MSDGAHGSASCACMVSATSCAPLCLGRFNSTFAIVLQLTNSDAAPLEGRRLESYVIVMDPSVGFLAPMPWLHEGDELASMAATPLRSLRGAPEGNATISRFPSQGRVSPRLPVYTLTPRLLSPSWLSACLPAFLILQYWRAAQPTMNHAPPLMCRRAPGHAFCSVAQKFQALSMCACHTQGVCAERAPQLARPLAAVHSTWPAWRFSTCLCFLQAPLPKCGRR